MVQPKPMAKRSRACSQCVAGTVDRLSALPDGLIHTVLSFLPAPEVVRTSLLSRRWRSLWRSAPRINLDMQDFGISMITNRDGALEEKWARFEDFATNLLLFHDNTSSLGEFRLSSHIYNQRHVDRWIRRGIEYCPSVLKIKILISRFKFPPIMGSNFCHLKTLHLRNVDLGSHFAGLLCSACPVMEDLELGNCKFFGYSSQGITSSTLKKLVLDCCVCYTGYPLVITVPSLANLCLMYGCYQSGISLCKMDSLVRAEIYVIEHKRTLSHHSQHELLCSLNNVTSLKLVGFQVEGMPNGKSDKFPIYHNMRTLDLHDCFHNDAELYYKLEALGSFLQRAPCLEKLILKYCMVHARLIVLYRLMFQMIRLDISHGSFCFCRKFYLFSDSEWDLERKNITLRCRDGKTFQCPKLKLIEVIYNDDKVIYQLIELLWSLGRSLPDASIKLKKQNR